MEMAVMFPDTLIRAGVINSTEYIGFDSRGNPKLKSTSCLGRCWSSFSRKMGFALSKMEIAARVAYYAENYLKNNSEGTVMEIQNNRDKTLLGLQAVEHRLFRTNPLALRYNPLKTVINDPPLNEKIQLIKRFNGEEFSDLLKLNYSKIVPENLRDDEEIALAAVRNSWNNFFELKPELRKNRGIVLTAAKLGNSYVLEDTSEGPSPFSDDEEIILAAALHHNDGERFMRNVSEAKKNNKEFALKLMKVNGDTFPALGKDLRADKQVALQAVESVHLRGFTAHCILWASTLQYDEGFLSKIQKTWPSSTQDIRDSRDMREQITKV